MSRKARFSAAIAVFLGSTLLITGQSFAASTPSPKPVAETPPAARPSAAPIPSRARQPVPVRVTPRFTG